MKAVSVDVIGLVLSCVTNLIVSSAGFRSIQSCDRDILMPFAIVIFLFYPMLISLPEAHYKFTNFGLSSQLSLSERAKEADEIYPYAFLFCLLSIALCAFADKYLINPNFTVEVYENERSKNTMKTNQLALSFLLTISITVQNMISFYFVCLEDNQTKTIKEIALFYCFNIIIYYAYGYLLGIAEVNRQKSANIFIVGTFGLIAGFGFSLFLPPSLILLSLSCVCAGIQVYCSIFLCFPSIFSNGQDSIQDKYRYFSICGSLLLTILYYPICYMLRI